MANNIKIVAMLHIGLSLLGMLAGVIMFIIFSGLGVYAVDGQESVEMLTSITKMLGRFLILVSVPGLVGGIGLLFYKKWSRIVLIIVSVLDLLNIPFGTALGIYSLWVLFNDETVKVLNEKRR